MQQLETSKQIVEEEQKYKRECKGRSLALTRNVYLLVSTDTFYCQSESSDNIYYFVKFKSDVLEWCSCPDSSTRNVRCKHLHAVTFAIRLGTLKDIDRLPTEAKVSKQQKVATVATKSAFTADDYSF